jgi:hypothetical protein
MTYFLTLGVSGEHVMRITMIGVFAVIRNSRDLNNARQQKCAAIHINSMQILQQDFV